MRLLDGHGRVHDDVRVSVTDRCNLRCSYCMPVEPEWFPRREILSYEELHRVVGILAARGVRKVRITGGEPLVRRDLDQFVRLVASTRGIADVSLTTNGALLAGAARTLAAAGLRRVNVSLDTLDPARFRELTRRDHLGRVLEGLEAARSAGLEPIKLNTVLLRGVNDHEVEEFVERARDNGWEVRFIEFMPLENGGTWDLRRVVAGREVRERIHARWPLEPCGEKGADARAPASRYRFTDGRGYVGFIDSITAPFCADCSRLRLTADGKFRVCLYDPAEVDLKAPIRSGADDGTLERILREAIALKGRGGALDILEKRRAPVLSRTMHQIGG